MSSAISSLMSSPANPGNDSTMNPPRSSLRILAACYHGGEFAHDGLLACEENVWGLRSWLQGQGHTLTVTSDIQGPNSEFDQHLPNADIVITQPFWPAYMREDRLKKSSNLKLILTAGVGSDHIDLDYCKAHGITVAEISGSNAIGVAEHTVLSILAMLKQFKDGLKQTEGGEWNIAAISHAAFDLAEKNVGVVAVGRIGEAVLKRLKPFNVKLHYWARHRLSWWKEQQLGVTYHPNVESLISTCEVVSLHVPAVKETEGMFDEKMLRRMKKGAYLVNTARGKLVDRDALVKIMNEGHLAGYAGDVWEPEPAPSDHPWRTLPRSHLTPHISGDSHESQQRIASGLRTILTAWIAHQPVPEEFLMANPVEHKRVGMMEQIRKSVASSIAPSDKGGKSAAEQRSAEVQAQDQQAHLPIVVVCGATGQQGGSVARALYHSNKWCVRGITRHATSDAAQKLKADCPGITFIESDLLERNKLQEGMQGAKAVFCVTDFYQERNLAKAKEGKAGELEDGSAVAEAAHAAGVEYFVMSSLVNAEEVTDGRWQVMHFTGKQLVSQHARELGLSVIDVQPGVFMQNWSTNLFPKIDPQADGSIEWRLPVRHDVALPLIDINQYGVYVKHVLDEPARWVGKHVLAASEYLTLDQAAAIYEEVSKTPTYFKRQTMEEYRQENKELPYVDEYVEQFSFFNEFGYFNGESLRDTLRSFPHTHTYREWLIASGWRTPPSMVGSLMSSMNLGAQIGDKTAEKQSLDDAHTSEKEKLDFEQAGSGGEKPRK